MIIMMLYWQLHADALFVDGSFVMLLEWS